MEEDHPLTGIFSRWVETTWNSFEEFEIWANLIGMLKGD